MNETTNTLFDAVYTARVLELEQEQPGTTTAKLLLPLSSRGIYPSQLEGHRLAIYRPFEAPRKSKTGKERWRQIKNLIGKLHRDFD